MSALMPDLFPASLPKGITYLPDYISKRQEHFLLTEIDKRSWDTRYRRRRQHYGRRYDVGPTGPGVFPDGLPGWLMLVFEKAVHDRHIHSVPQHALVNEYVPGQGINAHIDRADQPGGIVCSLSLGSGAEMVFTEPMGRRHNVYLEPCSLVRLFGPARDVWTHEIPARKSDRQGGLSIARKRRVSITFRNGAFTLP